MIPANREQFKNYCLRKLGQPVIHINVDDDQVEDRLDEAFEYWRTFHHDAVQKVPFKHQLTANNITNQYIETNPDIIGISRVLPIGDGQSGNSQSMFYDIEYQWRLSDFMSFRMTETLDIFLMKRHLELIDQMYIGEAPIQFNKHMNRLYLYWNWETRAVAGEWIIIEATVAIDPDTFTDIWSDRMLQNLATAYIKRQWGTNMKKFNGTVLLGGISLSGQEIFNEAEEEITRLEQSIRDEFEEPPHMITG